jgi:hypothetical protein
MANGYINEKGEYVRPTQSTPPPPPPTPSGGGDGSSFWGCLVLIIIGLVIYFACN